MSDRSNVDPKDTLVVLGQALPVGDDEPNVGLVERRDRRCSRLLPARAPGSSESCGSGRAGPPVRRDVSRGATRIGSPGRVYRRSLAGQGSELLRRRGSLQAILPVPRRSRSSRWRPRRETNTDGREELSQTAPRRQVRDAARHEPQAQVDKEERGERRRIHRRLDARGMEEETVDVFSPRARPILRSRAGASSPAASSRSATQKRREECDCGNRRAEREPAVDDPQLCVNVPDRRRRPRSPSG